MSISSTEEIVAELRAGRMVILVDEEDRENEGDLVLAADFVTPEAINFMIKHARGLVCLTLTEERCDALNLSMMTSRNGTAYGTNFTVSIEAAEGVTTGISAADRAKTIQVAVAKDTQPSDIVQPGHIFPLKAQKGGVLMRAGHTEAGCDLTAMAGLTPASVICEIMKDDGTMARLPDLLEFAAEHGLKIGTIADLIHYRSQNESLVERIAERPIKTAHGEFRLIAYRDKPSGAAHLALAHGDLAPGLEALVRVHQPVSVLDLLETEATTHSWNVSASMAAIKASERGVMVLLGRRAVCPVRRAGHAGSQAEGPRRQHGLAQLRYRRADPARPGRGQDEIARQPAQDAVDGRFRLGSGGLPSQAVRAIRQTIYSQY